MPMTALAGPIILSYYWPVSTVELDNGKITLESLHHFDMNSVTHIDILSHPVHGNSEIRQYWNKKGKYILTRVYPFRGYDKQSKKYKKLTTYNEIYENFDRTVKNSYGISIDELLGGGRGKVSKFKREIIIKVLSEIRKKYPKKFISVWGSAIWDKDNIRLLRSIHQHCDLFIPEIYLSEKITRTNGYSIIKEYVQNIEKQSPGIIEKMIIGIGLYNRLDTENDIEFSSHVKKQLRYIFSDPLLSKMNGIALYAPIHSNDKKLLTDIDSMIMKRFYPEKID